MATLPRTVAPLPHVLASSVAASPRRAVRGTRTAYRRREIGGRRWETNERKKIRAPAEEKDRRSERADGRTDGRAGGRAEGCRRRVDAGVAGVRDMVRAPGRGTEKSAAGAGPPLGAGSTREPDRPER